MKIRELQPSEISEAANLLSRGMNDNPINVAAFGSDAGRREAALARFFRAAMQGTFKRGELVGAFSDNVMLGICGMTPPGKCQPEMVEKLRMFANHQATSVDADGKDIESVTMRLKTDEDVEEAFAA